MRRDVLTLTVVGSAMLGASWQGAVAQSLRTTPYNWSGLYVGGHGGVAFGIDDTTHLGFPLTAGPGIGFVGGVPTAFGNSVTGTFTPFPTRIPGSGNGVAIGGAQIGYNVQNGQYVYGVEVDYTWFGHRRGTAFEQSFGLTGGSTSFAQTSATSTTPQTVTSNMTTTLLDFGKLATTTTTTAVSTTTTATTGTTTVTNSASGFANLRARAVLDDIVTVRGRVGYAVDAALFYVTGGLAIGEGHISSSASYGQSGGGSTSTAVTNSTAVTSTTVSSVTVTERIFPLPPETTTTGPTTTTTTANSTSSSTSSTPGGNTTSATWIVNRRRTLTGYVVGAGYELGITDNVSLKFESLYYNLGQLKAVAYGTGTTTGPGGTVTPVAVQPYSISRTLDGVIVQAGINYRF